MSGKGSKQRPTNKATFDENFDRIFNNKSESNKYELKKEKTNEDEEKHSGANTTTGDIHSSAS